MRWEPPAASASGTATDSVPAESLQPSAPTESAHPLLLAGTREGGRATLVVVGEIRPEGLASASAASLGEGVTEGSEWILFADGVRVGRLTAENIGTASEFCSSTATLAGTVEMVPDADAAGRLLALPSTLARSVPYAEFRPLTHEYDQRVASLSLAQAAIPRVGAPWPESGVLTARQDIQVFRLLGAAQPSVAATYLVRDQLLLGPPSAGAYALFLLAERVEGEYRGTFEWYHAADSGGKSAPRYFSHLDWDGDGQGEILLDVFGSDRRWYAALEQREDGWARTFESSCGTGASPAR
ncbi:MAG: hypothetical protein FJ207_09590 [Gemmatimonadetes bacterium]|nr:hypothetical protein [Gemmatimonadota bacterium]